jgi:methionyl-tRNA synthetase
MSFYLTTPIYYVNSTPHIGHAYTTLAADILVRHHRQRGDDTFFLTGTDEHASKVYRVAEAEGIDPKTYVDQIAAKWRELPDRVDAEIDFFIRTTDEGHKRFVQEFVQRIYDNGDIYEDTYAGLYCVGCEAFKTEDELVDGKCPEHDTVPEWIEEKNYFFRLSAYQDRLLALYDERPGFVQPTFRYNEARSFIAGGLQDFSLSRAGQPWGVPIPWDTEQVVYVWVDALINYLSALTYARPGKDLRDRYWPHARHLIGRTSSGSTASSGRRCSSPPATRCRRRSSSTATSSWTSGRSRSRAATSSILLTSSTCTDRTPSDTGQPARCSSGRTVPSRSTASMSATSGSSQTISAIWSPGRRP